MKIDQLFEQLVGAAIEVHREPGPGLLEGTYERFLVQEPTLRGIKTDRQKALPIHDKGLHLDEGYRIDALVEDQIGLELKVADHLNDIHTAQWLTYLKLSGRTIGCLLNFNVKLMKNGIKRIVNNHPEPSLKITPQTLRAFCALCG